MAWNFWVVDTRSGAKILQVHPSSSSFSRVLNGEGSGTHTFQLGERVVPRDVWRLLSVPWARTLVISWGATAVYAGVVVDSDYDRDSMVLSLSTADIRKVFSYRFPFGATSYYEADGVTPGKLVCSNLSLRSIVSRVMGAGMVGPFPIYSLPITLPPTSEAGPHSRTFYNYNFRTVDDLLDELQSTDGGPDIDFEPVWVDTLLRWTMRTGTPAQPQLTGNTFEWNTAGEKCGLTGIRQTVSGAKQASGVFSIGEGSEEDMRVVGFGLESAAPFPALDVTQSFKSGELDDTALFAQSKAMLDLLKTSTVQWEMGALASGYPGVDQLRLGSTLRVNFKDDPWVDDGWSVTRLIGFSGDMSERVRFDVQTVGV